MRPKLGDLLCQRGYISPQQLTDALSAQKDNSQKLGSILIETAGLSSRQLIEVLSEQAGIEKMEIEGLNINSDILSLVPADAASQYNVLPVGRENGRLILAMSDPFDQMTLGTLRMITGLSIRRCYCRPAELEKAIQHYYGSNVARMVRNLSTTEENEEDGQNGQLTASRLHELAREPSLVNLVNLVLLEAIESRASDVHIEPFENHVRIKYRIDGMLIEKSTSPKRLQAAIISRVKIMAGMNIAERYIPQDGHIEFTTGRGKIDLRVSTVPSVWGEAIVMRILDRSAALIALSELGMGSHTDDSFKLALSKAHGIILVTGPTGSGKTTTLYAALNHIYDPSLKIITVEDPVEYQLDGVVQMPINPRRGLTFGRGLRHILRQDPNIIMVGEIRDKETAEIAIRAALTGHLVLSTLHTNNAAGAINRLIDMGVEPFLLASSLEGVLAQRLVRKICPACRKPYKPQESLLDSLNNSSITIPPDAHLYHGTGCDDCNQTGMRGRVGIFEFLRVTEGLRKLIADRPTTEQIINASPEDYHNMRHDGIEKIMSGMTTPEEVLRVTQGIDEE